MDRERLVRVQTELVAWGVLEPQAPARFTRRFRAALARAAATLQAQDEGEETSAVTALERQVGLALSDFVQAAGAEAGIEHRRFALALHVASLPDAVRRLLGVPSSGP